jgi:hypothetical protein
MPGWGAEYGVEPGACCTGTGLQADRRKIKGKNNLNFVKLIFSPVVALIATLSPAHDLGISEKMAAHWPPGRFILLRQHGCQKYVKER